MTIHETAIVEAGAVVGAGTQVWHHAHVRATARIGRACTIGKDVYVDAGVVIGDHCKIQNGVSVYRGVTLDDEVFVGPHVTFTNDLSPRARGEWTLSRTFVRRGASLGAHATILAGLTIGEWAMIAAGAVVTSSVPAFALMRGHPARHVGYVCRRGHPLEGGVGGPALGHDGALKFVCRRCDPGWVLTVRCTEEMRCEP